MSSINFNPSASNGVSGLASGMDTESMVEKLLSSTQAKIDKQTSKKTQLGWKQDIYRDMISSLNGFKNKYFSYSSPPSTNMLSSAFFNTMSSISSSKAVGAVGGTSALAGRMSIDSISKLASATKVTSGKKAIGSVSGKVDLTQFEKKFTIQTTVKAETEGDPDIVKEKTLTFTGDTKQDILKSINDQLEADPDFAGVKAATDVDGNFVLMKEDADGKLDTKIDIKIKESTAMTAQVLGIKAGDGTGGVVHGRFDPDNTSTSLEVNLDGVKKTIKLDATQTDPQRFVENFNAELKKAFGSGVEATYSNGNISISADKQRQVSIAGTQSGLASLGLVEGISNKVNMSMKLSEINFANQLTGSKQVFEINGKKFEFENTESLSSIIGKINADKDADVKITYSTSTDQFSIESKTSGEGIELNMSQSEGNLLTSLFGSTDTSGTSADNVVSKGENAVFTVNGVDMEKNTNTFMLDGVTITLKELSTTAIDITTTRDTEQIFNGIKSYVEEYNKIIEKLNDLVIEEAEFKEFAPLTDAQKSELTESEVKAWEAKAKKGLVRGDSDIRSFLAEMRTLAYSKPDGSNVALYELGITTGDWKEGGKLMIDEEKLKAMIETNAEDIQHLFTGDNGLSKQTAAILDKYAKTSSGTPGIFVNTAGVKGGAMDTTNLITGQVRDINNRLATLNRKYETERQRYWKQFNQMEQMISSMNSQSSWLSSQFK